MSEMIQTNVVGMTVECPADENGNLQHITDYGSYQEILDDAKEEYREAKLAFFACPVEDQNLVKFGNYWEKAGKVLVGYAVSLFRMNPEDRDQKEESIRIMDAFTKDMVLRQKNIAQHRKIMRDQFPNDVTKLDRLTKANFDCHSTVQRALNTELHYRDLYMKNGGDQFSAQLERDTLAAAKAEKMREKIPHGHMFLPAQIYPPIDFPENGRCPDRPEAFRRMKDLPAEDLTYNTEIEEFVIREGYVSEDGLLTDQSVIFNTEEKTVTMQLTGCPPVVWPYWKPKNTRDMFERESRVAKYLRASYLQQLKDDALEVFEKWPYEFEKPYYDKKTEI